MSYTPKNTRERIAHRLKISKGQLEKVISMTQDDAYCIDIMHQIKAIESSLRQTGHLLLENHLKTCVAKSIKQGKAEESISEIMQVFNKKI